jgi:multiple sugar transport system permease protein
MFPEHQTIMAGAVAVILSMVMVFLIFQRFFVEGIATTGIKG